MTTNHWRSEANACINNVLPMKTAAHPLTQESRLHVVINVPARPSSRVRIYAGEEPAYQQGAVRLAGVPVKGSCSAMDVFVAKHGSEWILSGHECDRPEPTPHIADTLFLTSCMSEACMPVSLPEVSIHHPWNFVSFVQYGAMLRLKVQLPSSSLQDPAGPSLGRGHWIHALHLAMLMLC